MSTYQSQYTGEQIDEAIGKALNSKTAQALAIEIPEGTDLAVGYTTSLTDDQIALLKESPENYIITNFGGVARIIRRMSWNDGVEATFQNTLTEDGKIKFAFATIDLVAKTLFFQLLVDEPNLQSKVVPTIVANTSQPITVVADDGFDGLSKVEIEVDVPIVEPKLQTKEVPTITANTVEPIMVEPNEGYDGLSSVAITVDVPFPASYWGEYENI